MQTLDSAVPGAGAAGAVADFVSSGEGIERLSPFNGHRVVSETEIDPNTRELQVERELADGSTRLETQRLSRVGDEWKVQPGGEVQVMAMPGGGTGVMIQQGAGNGGAQLEMHVEQRAGPKP
jgi:hypothetical protein